MALCENLDADRTLCPVITHSDPTASLVTRSVWSRMDMDDFSVPVRSASSSLTVADVPKRGLRELRTVGSRHWHGKGT